jgi:hypothetical protein
VSSEEEPVGLLAQGNVVAAGQTVSLAVDNGSDTEVHYGTFATVDDPASHKPVPGSPKLFLLPQFTAGPHGIGPCVVAVVPAQTARGDYLASVHEVGEDREDLTIPIQVRGISRAGLVALGQQFVRAVAHRDSTACDHLTAEGAHAVKVLSAESSCVRGVLRHDRLLRRGFLATDPTQLTKGLWKATVHREDGHARFRSPLSGVAGTIQLVLVPVDGRWLIQTITAGRVELCAAGTACP